MLNISGIQEGVVLDHIQAGKSMDIYRYLRLGELDCTVAIIKNAKSNKMGKKDIIKICFSFFSVIIRHLFECNFLCSGLYRQGIISFLKGLKSIIPNAGRNVQLLKNASVIRSGGDWRKVCFKTVEKLPVMI